MPALRMLILWLGLVLGAWAGPGLQTLRFEHLQPEQLGAGGPMQCAVQDRLGQMWLGTSSGLVRYDGRRGKLFRNDARNASSLSHSWVQALMWQDERVLLVATADGLNVFDTYTEANERVALPGQRRVAHRGLRGLQPATEGKIWTRTYFELLLYEPRQRQFTPVPLEGLQKFGGEAGAYLVGLESDGQGGVWLVAGIELIHVDHQGRISQRWPLARPPKGRTDVEVMSVDKQGRAWVGGGGWLQLIDLRDGRQLPLPENLDLAGKSVHAVMADDEDTVWIGTGSQGLWRVPRGSAKAEQFRNHPAQPRSLVADSVSGLFQDRSGVLWVGSWSGQVSLADLRQKGWRSYSQVFSEPDTLPDFSVHAIEVEDDNHVWVATYGGGVLRLTLDTGQAQALDSGDLPLGYAQALSWQPGRGLWIGADTGAYLLPVGETRVRLAPLGEWTGKLKAVRRVKLDGAGQLWLGGRHGVLKVAANGEVQALPVQVEGGKATLSESAVTALLPDREGRLWVGTDRGLRLLAGEHFVQPLLADIPGLDLDLLKVLALAQDRRGRLWMGTEFGLFELVAAAGGRWRARAVTEVLGLPAGGVSNLLVDQDDGLWFASAAGLVRLDAERRQARHYDGLARRLLGGIQVRAAALGSQGRLFFGQSGVIQFNPAAYSSNAVPPQVLLSDLQVYNRSLRDARPEDKPDSSDPSAQSLADVGVQGVLERAQAVRLSHREGMVSFDLRAQHFYSPGQVRYAWKLEGFDQRWIEGRPGQGLATYTNLDAGNFRLMAKAANPDGVWGEPRQLLEVEVLPPWWKSAWFRGLVGLLLLAGLVSAWQLRLRGLKREQLRLESEVARRTAEVQAQRQQIATLSEIGRELTASLDMAAIQNALFKHVASLMPATTFGVGLVNREEGVVEFDFMIHRGQAIKPYRRSLDAAEQPAARCVREGRPLLIGEFEQDIRLLDAAVRERPGQQVELADGSSVPSVARSAIYVPLQIKGETMGVLVVLSDQAHAFDKTHLDMLQTLGAYTAVALDNADAYHALQEAQHQLVEQRKLAAMGHLVAGVAHELNTPLGNGLLAASTLFEDARKLTRVLNEGQLRRADLQHFERSLDAGEELLLRSLHKASDLVSSFKQLAVDPVDQQRSRFELASLAEELKSLHLGVLAERGHRLQLEVPDGLMLDSYPSALHQVLKQWLDNAIEHGFGDRRDGLLRLVAEPLGAERLRLRLEDDGAGIAPEVIGRVFDPFFTTRFGRGSNGLGLHLVYTLVNSLLGGQVTVTSEPGQGAVFEILLPLVAPRRD
ncbi:two-component regulator propeller domain-containing protein [Pelomonas sp. SE-A7]|uniref:two-component regulator propeller domain-containing protein n=1 Tax=Pelomonas sp. SE-A7 TaxID=3054953 RepID=UPI00259D0FD4|nr:two-component regulator propeller domain-containing protein [Pelomonas sp. SE-A7]MDM4766026.1 two-component regulator propeller domain-containing protein [Pelomonas sp. SE-A7]